MAGRKKQKKQQQDGKPGVNDKEKKLRTNTSTNNQQLESSETMSVGNQIAIWAPRIISWLPQIIKAGHDIYALYCRIRDDHRKNEQQDDAVLKAMRLLNKNGDDIDRVLQNPAEKRALMEGLTILMNRINAHDRGQAKGGGDGFGNGKTSPSGRSNWDDYGSSSFRSSSSSYSPFSSPSSEKSSGPIGSYKECQVCYRAYNMTDRKPTVLICGHTFCRECMGHEVHVRGCLRCPVCKTLECRPVAALPLDYALVEYLDERNQSKGACGSNVDDSCGYSNGDSCGYGDDSCVGNSLTFEQQIEYAILLSQQEAQVQGASYVERKWQEVVASEEEDMMLAMAIRASEMYEDSRRLAERQAEGGACCRDSMREEEQQQNGHDDCSVWRQKEHNNENDNDCSRWRHSRNNDDDNDDDCVRSRHSRNNDDDNDDDCSRWKSSKPGNEYDDDDCSKWKCGKDECVDGKMDEETKKKHVAFLRDEEEVLIQMAIRASEEEQQNGHDDCSVWRQNEHNNENDDDCSRWRHSRNNDDNDDDCSRLKSSKPGTEYADDDCSKWKCGKDDCGDGEMDEETKKKHLAFLRDEEEVLIQMAIRASLEEQNDYSDLPALEEDKTDN